MSGDIFVALLGATTTFGFIFVAEPKTYEGRKLVCRCIASAFAVLFFLQGAIMLLVHFGPGSLRAAQDLQDLLTAAAMLIMTVAWGALLGWGAIRLRAMPGESTPREQQ